MFSIDTLAKAYNTSAQFPGKITNKVLNLFIASGTKICCMFPVPNVDNQ